jgi:hypothetical protein
MTTSNSNKINKQDALELLGLKSLDDLNLGLLEFASALSQQGTEVPAELHDPEASATISKDVLKQYRDFVKQVLNQPKALACQLPESQPTTGTQMEASDAILPIQYSQQVLSGVKETLLELHQINAHLDGMEIADTVWYTMLESLSLRTNLRFNQLTSSLSADIQEKFASLQAQSKKYSLEQSESLGKLGQQVNGHLITAQEIMRQASELPL